MKTCPKCRRTYADSVDFCLRDGKPLVNADSAVADGAKTDTSIGPKSQDIFKTSVLHGAEKADPKKEASTPPITAWVPGAEPARSALSDSSIPDDAALPPWEAAGPLPEAKITLLPQDSDSDSAGDDPVVPIPVVRPDLPEPPEERDEGELVGDETVLQLDPSDDDSALELDDELSLDCEDLELDLEPLLPQQDPITIVPLESRLTPGAAIQRASVSMDAPGPPVEEEDSEPRVVIYTEEDVEPPPPGEDEDGDDYIVVAPAQTAKVQAAAARRRSSGLLWGMAAAVLLAMVVAATLLLTEGGAPEPQAATEVQGAGAIPPRGREGHSRVTGNDREGAGSAIHPRSETSLLTSANRETELGLRPDVQPKTTLVTPAPEPQGDGGSEEPISRSASEATSHLEDGRTTRSPLEVHDPPAGSMKTPSSKGSLARAVPEPRATPTALAAGARGSRDDQALRSRAEKSPKTRSSTRRDAPPADAPKTTLTSPTPSASSPRRATSPENEASTQETADIEYMIFVYGDLVGVPIFINDVRVGTTPYTGRLKGGTHVVRITPKGFPDETRVLELNDPAKSNLLHRVYFGNE